MRSSVDDPWDESARGQELVVLLDDEGRAVGTADKQQVHGTATPLHLAFSCYVFDPAGRLLLTRRALAKSTWPGVWTNSFCGHPGPGEQLGGAIRRRARQELGIDLRQLSLALPRFRYEAVMDNGVRENEMCPVFLAVTANAVQPDPDEVEQVEWVDWATFHHDVVSGRREVSPWCRPQLRELSPHGSRPAPGSASDWSTLPPAALG
jgi:isopentenyl-diphosphate Delta-isomerase